MDTKSQIVEGFNKRLEEDLKDAHSLVQVPLELHTLQHNALYFYTAPLPPSFIRTPSTDLLGTLEPSIKISMVPVNWQVSEEYLEQCKSPEVAALLGRQFASINSKVPIQFIDSPSSVLVFGQFQWYKDYMSYSWKLTGKVGIGISLQFKEKMQEHCRHTCNKFIKCLLKPEECYLSFIMKAVGRNV